jgi:hypothetical protein
LAKSPFLLLQIAQKSAFFRSFASSSFLHLQRSAAAFSAPIVGRVSFGDFFEAHAQAQDR